MHMHRHTAIHTPTQAHTVTHTHMLKYRHRDTQSHGDIRKYTYTYTQACLPPVLTRTCTHSHTHRNRDTHVWSQARTHKPRDIQYPSRPGGACSSQSPLPWPADYILPKPEPLKAVCLWCPCVFSTLPWPGVFTQKLETYPRSCVRLRKIPHFGVRLVCVL